MANPCAPHTSRPQFGVPAAVVVDQQYVQNLLPAGLAWLYPYLPWMHGLQIGSVAAFCAADPPSFSVPSAVDFYLFLTNSALGTASTVSTFLENITRYYLWYKLCECTTGTPTGPSSGPAEPANLPVVNPPTVVADPPIATGNCMAVFGSLTAMVGIGTQAQFYSDLVPNTARYADFTCTSVPNGATHNTISFDVVWIGARAPSITPELRRTNYVLASGGSVRVQETVPQGARALQLYSNSPGVNCTDYFQQSGGVFCDAVPGSPAAVPCPPDPAVRQLLKQIYDLLTLVQRQAVPFAYVYGANHAGLTGSGSIAVQGLIGVSVDVTTLPASYGTSAGTPTEIYDIGFVTLGTADGWDHSRRIDHDGSLVFPPEAGVFTLIGYTLSPGVVVAIRELVREP